MVYMYRVCMLIIDMCIYIGVYIFRYIDRYLHIYTYIRTSRTSPESGRGGAAKGHDGISV